MPRVLLLSAYHADSHKYWCDGLIGAFPDYEWTLLSLPPRHFSWRIRGNSLSWAFAAAESVHQPYDLLIATSMVDLAGLRGLVPTLGQVPALVYFHENQFAYPRSARQHASVEPQMVNLYSALAADVVVFNSDYNRASFLQGVTELLKRLPDEVPTGLTQRLAEKSRLIPVPLEETCFIDKAIPSSQPLTLIWNHRWEYDKAPDRLLAALKRVPPELPLCVHVVGQQFREQPPVMGELHNFLRRRHSLGAWGYVASRDAYRALLSQSHAVISTALHDFQGLAVLEAVAAGCVPLVPNRLAYPEWFGGRACYSASPDPDDEASALAAAIMNLASAHRAHSLPTAPSVDHFRWRHCRVAYQQLMQDLWKTAVAVSN